MSYETLAGSVCLNLTDGTPLSQVSERDKVWDEHRASADIVQRYYASSDFNRYAQRISFCADFIYFKLNVAGGLTLSSSRFCRVRYCPICQWRRSCMWKSKAHSALPKVSEAYPDYRWLFLTLTIRNCAITDLRETVDHLNKSFARLTKLKEFPGVGWIKSLEVTRGRDGSAHPHFHVLLLVKPSYFSTYYVSKHRWSELWQQCLRIDYLPMTHIRPIKEHQSVTTIIPEILKYQTKPSDLVAERQWFLTLTDQMHKIRAVAVGGVLKEYMRELEEEPDDLIGEGDDETIPNFLLGFRWRTQIKKYISVD